MLNDYIESYLNTALWSSTECNEAGDDCVSLDENYDAGDCSQELIDQSGKDITDFIEQAGDLLKGERMSQVMHDFWLTRNGHGAGFWDGDYEQTKGEKLTEIAHNMGTVDLYVGDDGQIYC